MGYQVAGFFLGPLFFLQGRKVRKSTPILPEPEGDRTGTAGSGRPLKLLVLGDSAAAGVGVSEIRDSLVGQLSNQLGSTFLIQWSLIAKTGATTPSTLRYLRKIEPGEFDICVTSLGVNDVTSGVSCRRWLIQQQALREFLRNELAVKHIVLSGLPPVHGFPVLPQPLRWWLGAKATAFDNALQQAVQDESDVSYLNLRFSEEKALMATDGFHPGPQIYADWAARAAALIRAKT